MLPRILSSWALCAALFAIALNRTLAPRPLAWTFLQGLVIAIAFYPVIRWTETKRPRLFGVIWLVLMVVGVITIASEGAIFITVPLRQILIGNLNLAAAYTVLALALAYSPRWFGLGRAIGVEPRLRSPLKMTLAILPAAVFYLLVYFVFGGLFYQLLTKPYYTHQVAGGEALTASMPAAVAAWFPAIQIARGLLLAVAVVPIVRMLRLGRWSTAAITGLILWTVGGLAPLLPPNPVMPGRLRLYHTMEIFTQNFTLGVAIVFLMRPGTKAAKLRSEPSVAPQHAGV